METYIQQVGAFIQAHQEWAGPLTFLLTLGESMVVVGLFIPATALLLLTGGLIGSGTLTPWTIVCWGIAGAVLGDALSYLLGRWLGTGVLYRWPLNRQRRAVAQARLFFRRYGFASVVIGRFLGPLRSTVPTVAGVMGMGAWRFQGANVLSGVLWVPLMLAPGYFTARELGTAQGSQEFSLMAGSVAALVLGAALMMLLFRRRRPAVRPSRRD